MTLVAITFVCFVFSNVFSTLMVQAEARNRAVLGATFEAAYALFWIYAAKYALSTSPNEIAALLAGNFLGAWVGVKVGEKWVKDHEEVATQSRIEELEAELDIAHLALQELEHENDIHHGEIHDHE
jgi:hypothetical protein